MNAECTGTTGAFVCTCQEGFKTFRSGMCISEESVSGKALLPMIALMYSDTMGRVFHCVSICALMGCVSCLQLEAVEMIEDIINNATNVPPSCTLSSLRSLLRKLSAKVNVPPETSEVSY